MRRVYKKRALLDKRQLGFAAFAFLIMLVAYTILTPSSAEIARISSPDGSKTARLRKIYYVSQPSYKVDYREPNKLIWLNLLYLRSYTNAPHQTVIESIEWGSDSETLYFNMNGTSIWSHAFND